MSDKENTLDDFIKNLDELNKKNTVKIFVPSAGKKLGFNLFSVTQHKELLKSIFEGYAGIVRSSIIYNDIINTNCHDDYTFTLADRSFILTQLRKESISSKYTADGNNYDLSDLPEPEFKFTPTQDIEYKGIKVTVTIPSFERDDVISKKLVTEINNIPEDKQDEETLTTVLSYEIIKFIEKISIDDNIFSFSSNNLFESKQIINSLPLKLNNMIIEAISDFRVEDEKNITFSDGTIVEIDASFLSDD